MKHQEFLETAQNPYTLNHRRNLESRMPPTFNSQITYDQSKDKLSVSPSLTPTRTPAKVERSILKTPDPKVICPSLQQDQKPPTPSPGIYKPRVLPQLN